MSGPGLWLRSAWRLHYGKKKYDLMVCLSHALLNPSCLHLLIAASQALHSTSSAVLAGARTSMAAVGAWRICNAWP